MRIGLKLIVAMALVLPCTASGQATQRASAFQPPRHTVRSSPLLVPDDAEVVRRADAGTQIELDRDPAQELAEHRKLDRALQSLAAQRAGTVDAYVVSVALDSDPVFGREARSAAAVLERRYDAAGRSIVLAGSDGTGPSVLPRGSPATLAIALARVAELMDPSEDVLVLYTTSHGAPFGLYYHDGDSGYGAVSPRRMKAMLDQLGLRNRLLILSACFSGVFVPELQSPTTAILTAAASDRTSFGCAADNDWTFFGDALLNRALRRPQPLGAAFVEAEGMLSDWERQVRTTPSQPQIRIGAAVRRWLDPLEQRMPREASAPVGRPALETSLRPSSNTTASK